MANQPELHENNRKLNLAEENPGANFYSEAANAYKSMAKSERRVCLVEPDFISFDKIAGHAPNQVNKEHRQLGSLAKDLMTCEQFRRFALDLSTFEYRSADMEQQFEKQGLSLKEAKQKASEQVISTYREVRRLLKSETDSAVPIDGASRIRLAQEIISNAANPTDIRQGKHRTCNVAVLEGRVYTREPASAARLVVDVATSGAYIASDGTRVVLDKQSLRPDQDADRKDAEDNRTYASQLFQVTAVNVYYAKFADGIRYEQHPVDPNIVPVDTGERLVDYSSNPPKTIGFSWWDKHVNGYKDTTFHRPSLFSDDLIEVYQSITGKTEKDWVWEAGVIDEQIVSPDSARDLEQRLLEAKTNGQLPVAVVVHSGNEPFLTDSYHGASGVAGSWHIVSALDIEPGAPARIKVDNQWSQAADHLTNNRLTPGELFGAMKVPGDTDRMVEITQEVLQNLKAGKPDDFKELELLRLRRITGQLTDDQYDQAFLAHLRESQTRWHRQFSGGTSDYVVSQNISKTTARQNEIIAALSPEKRIDALRLEYQSGFYDRNYLDKQLANNISQIKTEYRADNGTQENPNAVGRRKPYQAALRSLVEIMDGLPSERQDGVRNEVQSLEQSK